MNNSDRPYIVFQTGDDGNFGNYIGKYTHYDDDIKVKRRLTAYILNTDPQA